ncbi:MAG TPA: UDP-N-acetylglucosamine 2-epimerase (non-hydrolyzing) [Kiritimatiellia bacterium]|nr:UDP-N-acetylglucosamine 2-epimerase (non-hydrolyzing) [Kiritimatiellia bacterium]HRZ12573.1 UDP-N-acetylglucosamine 2-epimerase (non-hydrolyzing) [Kiritimatiellia bacterium]HSA17651.1 UDP-N-acetylglucosamine 2-epimerase (non-hydrolyzing) [Kiritimatiellia bacterium]
MNAAKKIALLYGARPNYMKVFPLWREMKAPGSVLRPLLIHTGQHYDASMSDVFFRNLAMDPPDHALGVGAGSHAAQTGRIMQALEPVLGRERPAALVVVGDVNSTMAGALVAVKMGIPVAHVEAGLRSGDRAMPEEINRVVTDAVADCLLASCRDAVDNLRREGIPEERIHFVGNVMMDSLEAALPRLPESKIVETLGLAPRAYVLVTLHRPSNVDDPGPLRAILGALEALSADRPVVFPVHPRTRKVMESNGVAPARAGFRCLDPLGYLDFLRLETEAGLVVTDSGGIQEETSYLGIPCLTLRENTERPVTITAGTNRLVPPRGGRLLEEARRALAQPPGPRPRIEGWDGRAASRIIPVLQGLVTA